MKIKVKRNNTPTVELPLERGLYTDVLMGEHSLVFTLSTPDVLDIQIGDTITYKGQVMTINQEPDLTRSHLFDYVIRFEGQRYTLSRFLIKDEGALTFDYMADLETYMFMYLESINSVDAGWTVGALEEVEPFALEFDQVDHLTALNMIAEACQCEWQIIGKQITVKKTIGIAHNYPLAYGRENGLYNIRRVMLENSKIVTRAYAVGGSQNLPASYSKKKLTLSGYLDDTVAQAIYGIREGVIEDEEIYPKRTSTATAVGQINEGTFTLSDSTIDFDLNNYKIDDNWSIVFKSGMLNGQQFKILSYNHSTKTIRYEANKDSNGELTPKGATLAEIGDSYTLIGIRMPESYVTAALAQLEAKRLEYLNSNKVPRVVYEASLDPLDLKRNNKEIKAGDILPFTDEKIGLDDDLRVTSVRYSATFPELLFNGMTYEIEVGQEVTYTRLQKIEKDIKETKEVVTQYSKQSWENDRRNVQAVNEFKEKVFDPDGNLQNALIQGIAALFGSDSMYFDLEDVSIAVNAGADANRLTLTAGRLIHKSYEIAGLGYIWNLSAFDQDDLEPLKTYYLSAKVSRTALTGEWVLSESELSTESEVGYWYFNLGILSSVIEGSRTFRPTRMFTLISGGSIETDVITAKLINVQKLFAQEIVATQLHVTGNSRVAGFSIDNTIITSIDTQESRKIHYSPGGAFARDTTDKNHIELKVDGLKYNVNRYQFDEMYDYNSDVNLELGTDNSILNIHATASSTNPLVNYSPHLTGLKLRMNNGTAIDFVGKIVANGQNGFTGKVAFIQGYESNNPYNPIVKYQNFYSGIMVGVTDS